MLEIKNKSFSHIRLNDIRERMQEQNQKCKLTLSLSTQKREKTRPKRSLNKNVIVISVMRNDVKYCVLS